MTDSRDTECVSDATDFPFAMMEYIEESIRREIDKNLDIKIVGGDFFCAYAAIMAYRVWMRENR